MNFVLCEAIINDLNSEKDKKAHAERVMRIFDFDAGLLLVYRPLHSASIFLMQ